MPVRCALFVCAAVLIAACGGGQPSTGGTPAPSVIQVDGSSTVFPISEAVAEEFQKANPGIRVTVGISGTGGGFQKFCRGETDISDASRPISATEIEACSEGGHRVHRAADRLRRPRRRREPEEHLGLDDHRRRAEDAVGAGGAGQDHALESGAARAGPTARFTCSAPASTPAPTTTSPRRSSGKQGASRGDFTSSEDDNVLVQGVAQRRTRRSASCRSPTSNRTRARSSSCRSTTARRRTATARSCRRPRQSATAPISRSRARSSSTSRARRPTGRRSSASSSPTSPPARSLREVGYVELTPQIYDLAKKHFADRKVGTAFGAGGSQVGMTLEELLAREQ